jgi:hypothetical protein
MGSAARKISTVPVMGPVRLVLLQRWVVVTSAVLGMSTAVPLTLAIFAPLRKQGVELAVAM